MSTRTLIVCILLAPADAGFAFSSGSRLPITLQNHRPRSQPSKVAATPAKLPAGHGFAAMRSKLRGAHAVLPTLSYAGLASVTVGAAYIVQPAFTTAWHGVALVGGFVGVPAAFLLAQLLISGGTGIAKRMGGEPADAKLTSLAHEAAAAVGVPPPKYVYEIPKFEPNAFAASGLGGAKDTTVAVTKGLRRTLSTTEMKAVLAHEMGHLRHRDVSRNMHIAIAAAGLGGVYEAGRFLLDSSRRGSDKSSSDKDEGSSAGIGLALMAGGFAAQAVAHLSQLAASRSSELQADLAAAEAFGADALISALQKIDAAAARAPADLRQSGAAGLMAHAMISDGPSDTKAAKGKVGFFGRLSGALRTHPPTHERVEALEQAAKAGLVASRGPTRTESSLFGGR